MIRDPSRAPIPFATVAAKNLEGAKREVSASDREGHFVFSDLPLGKYAATVEMAGFKPFQSDPLLVSQKPATLEATLEVGSV